MSNHATLVEEAIRNWEAVREGTVAEVENIPERHFDFRAGEGARSVREIALHIAESGVVFTGELVREEGAVLRARDPAVAREHTGSWSLRPTKAELIEMLRFAMQEDAARLRRFGERLATTTVATADGPPETRLTGLRFAIAHEMYHRGQLAFCARACGLTPALTRRLQSEGGG